MTDESNIARARQECLDKEQLSPAGFLRNIPDFNKDGFDIATGRTSQTKMDLEFGVWEDRQGDDTDDDISVLKDLHTMAVAQFGSMVETFAAVRDDDDPSLNADGRLKIAARILEPKLNSLAQLADREFVRVAAQIEQAQAEVGKAIKVANPLDIAVHDSIRRHWHGMDVSTRMAAVSEAKQRGDVQTLQALATAPAYLSGLTEALHAEVAQALAERLAPEATRRITTLRAGMTKAAQALSVLDRKANRFIDFKKARALIERKALRSA